MTQENILQIKDDQISFFCPGCKMKHTIQVGDGPGVRWDWNGSVDQPTFRDSIKVEYPHWMTPHVNGVPQPRIHINDICHSIVTNGQIEFLEDCTHSLVRQTVALPSFPVKQE